MACKLVTCPESAHLECIEFEDTPLGMLIAACSRFDPCEPTCPRTCAARLDRKQCSEERISMRLHIGDNTTFDLRLF